MQITEMGMQIKHFSHEQHLLILNMKGESRGDEIIEKSLCHGCQTPITPSKPIYSCTENCRFFLHKTCAESPTYITSHSLHPQHPLTLLEKPPYVGGKCECCCCGLQSWSNFTYHCETCDFDMDIFCATLEGQKLDHPSHKHALLPVRRRVTFGCQACGETKEDASYICSSGCLYWIHESCASLPPVKKREDHDHPLSLAYCLSDDYITYKLSCDVCSERLIKPYLWVYHCGLCRYVVHIKCIETKKEYTGGRWINHTGPEKSPILLPTDDFAGDLLETSSFQNYHLESNLRKFKNETSYLQRFVQRALEHRKNKIHGHSVIHFDVRENSNTRGKEIRCEACADLIVSICCKRVNHANYFLHVTCALQDTIFPNRIWMPDEPTGFRVLSLRSPANTWDFFKCHICKLDCNGYPFYASGFPWDVKCALLHSSIDHEAHPHKLVDRHRYFRKPHDGRGPRINGPCSGCGEFIVSSFFECEYSSCSNYLLGYECALLPKTVRHKWDKHLLILSFPPFSDHPERFYCEACEEEIHPLRWQYRCRECDQSFHPRCIPQATSSRNIKFGIDVNVNEHPHTLVLIREADRFNSACHTCRKTLYGC